MAQLDASQLETVLGKIHDKVVGIVTELKALKSEDAAEQAKIDELTAKAQATADYTGDVINPDTPPVDPNAPIPDAPVIPSGRRRG